ncbi:TPA: hypothetical protein QCH82_002907 [Enterobacter kobei]|nr:hypothetical protein [Enterobacter kobei]
MSTITKEFTKEQLTGIIAAVDDLSEALEEDRKSGLINRKVVERWDFLNDRAAPPEVVKRLAEIALASLEAEAVADVVAWSSPNEERTCDVRLRRHDINPGQLYTDPPAPVSVPDEATPENIEILASTYAPCGVTYQWDRDECNAAADSWTACRAAILQGAEPSKMSGIMPDYEGSAMTQRELFQAGWEAHHAAMLQAGAPVQFGWSKGHFGYHTLFNAIGKAVNIQGGALLISVSAFEDAMLAAAPQLEVK